MEVWRVLYNKGRERRDFASEADAREFITARVDISYPLYGGVRKRILYKGHAGAKIVKISPSLKKRQFRIAAKERKQRRLAGF